MKSIGIVINIVKGPITAQNAQGDTRTLTQGDTLYLHDTIITTAQSYIKIKFNDGTLLKLGPLSQMHLDKYTYVPHEGGEFQASILSGIFHYISGKLGGYHPGEHSKIITPSANIGIRGSEIEAQIGTDGSTTVLYLQGVISVISRYAPQTEEIAYERGVSIYVPAEALPPLVTRISEEEIQEYQEQHWQLLGNIEGSREGEELRQDLLIQPPPLSRSDEFMHFHPHPFEGQPPPFAIPKDKEERSDPLTPREDLRGEPPERMIENFPWKGGGPFKPYQDNILDQPPFDKPPPGERFPGNDEHFLPGEPSPEDHKIGPHGDTPNEGYHETKPDKIKPDDFSLGIELKEDELREGIVDPRGKIASNEPPSHGKASIDEEGRLTYDPTDNYHGEDRLTYALEDGRSGTIVFTIEPVNDDPIVKEKNNDIWEDTVNFVISKEELLKDFIVDVDGDPLRIIGVAAPPISALEVKPDLSVVQLPHGNVRLLNEQGDIIYSPDPDFNGQEEFIYLVQDSQGAITPGRIVVHVLSVPDPPVANDDQRFLNNLRPVTFLSEELIENDLDRDGDKLQITGALNPINGQVSFKSGEITFTPSSNFTQGGFDYILTDGQATDTGHVSIGFGDTHLDPILLPLAEDDTLVTHSGTLPFKILPNQLLKNDLEPDRLTITRVEEAFHGQVNLDQGNVIFTPDAQFAQSETGRFTYYVTDGQGHIDSALVTVNLRNSPPQAHEDSFTFPNITSFPPIAPSRLLSNDTDAEGDSLSITSLINGVNGTVAFDQQGNIVFTPIQEALVKNNFGTFNYQISDGNKESNQALVTINFPNPPPIAGDDKVFIGYYQSASFKISFAEQLSQNDSDPNQDPLSILSVNPGLNGQVILGEGGNIEFIPTTDFIQQGGGQFTYQLTDGRGGTDEASVALVIRPITAMPDSKETHDVTPLMIAVNDLLKNDLPREAIQFSQLYNPIHGTINLNGENLEFIPDEHFISEQSGKFTYEIKDNYGNIASAEVNLTLKNEPPIAHDGKKDINNGTLLTLDDLKEPLGLFDQDGDPLHITKVTPLDETDQGKIILQQDNILFTGPLTPHDLRDTSPLLIEINDGHGGIAQATVAVHRNIPPFAHDGEKDLGNGTLLTLDDLKEPLGLFDHNGDSLHITKVTPLNEADQGKIILQQDNILFTGPLTPHDLRDTSPLLIEINDGHEGTAQAILTVHRNIPPFASDDEVRKTKNQPIEISPLNNDSDANGDTIEELKITSQPTSGTVTQQGEKLWLFEPAHNFTGTVSWTYTIKDQHGAVSPNATVKVTVVNTPPDAQDDPGPFRTFQDTPLSIPKQELLMNDQESDPNDPLDIMDTQGIIGTESALLKDSLIEFKPMPGFTGAASFIYTATDQSQAKDDAKVTVTVMPHLTAIDDTLPSTSRNTEKVLFSGQDTLILNDIKSTPTDQLTITDVGEAINGTVKLLDAQGNIQFIPTPDFSGQASFQYTVQDNWDQKDTAKVTIEVVNTNQAPIITLPTHSLAYDLEAESLKIAPGARVTDDSPNFDQGRLQIAVMNPRPYDLLEIHPMEIQGAGVIGVSNPSGGTITFNGLPIGSFLPDVSTGGLLVNLNDQANAANTSTLLQAITYRLPTDINTPLAEDTRTINFTLKDGDGGTSQPVSCEISIGNIPPIATQDFLSRDFNLSTVIPTAELLQNDTDPNPMDVPQVTEVNSSNHDEVKVELIGEEVQLFIDGLVHGNFDSVRFNYTISDGRGGEDTSEVIVTPTNVIRGDVGNDDFKEKGTEHQDIFLGEGGNDTFTSSAGNDILIGGEGDDLFLFNPIIAAGVTFIGGEGHDTLRLEGITHTFIDMAKNSQLSEAEKFTLQGIETLDLSGQGNQLKLNLQDVLELSEQNHLTIEGDSSNLLVSTGQGWRSQGLQDAYYLYTGSQGTELLVNKDIVQLIS